MKPLLIILTIIASASHVLSFQQELFIRGQVLSSENGDPIPFASMIILQSNIGTASDIDGSYFLKPDSAGRSRTVRVSCIGFKSKRIRMDSLRTNPIVLLSPEIQLLAEVVIQAYAADAREILQQAIDRIPQNYLQRPFNMEFYSINTTSDTVTNKSYTVESVFTSYYESYHKSAQKNYKIIHKREKGDYFMKETTRGMSQWPMWELALNDIYSNQTEDQIVQMESFDEINPELVGTQLYEGDTVFVIRYGYKYSGMIYISSKDYAILKHSIISSGRGYTNRTEIIYRKHNGKYFPYAASGEYLHEYKVAGKKTMLKISNRTRLNRIMINDFVPFGHHHDLWFPKNINYDEVFWKNNYPE